MSKVAIRAENISKAYRLGQIGSGTISRDLERWWAKTRGKEDPFLKIGEANDRTVKGNSDVVWSLKDINFEIHQGDAVGIIGRNGAGKSTLLKVLSRVTSPTTGQIAGTGRIASLLEVGTGFHPELTGRENIYLNGAILGMRKAEIKRKFDEIVNFSGVERYIDTPVKRYSSGMYVRLAFAVAAHLESEILIVDEVLAVGDAEFQKKCLGKMGEVSKGEGRTVLFVSHNMQSMLNLCNRGITMVNGRNEFDGDIMSAVAKYNALRKNNQKFLADTSKKNTYINSILFKDNQDEIKSQFETFEDITIEIQIVSDKYITNVNIGYGVDNAHEVRMFTLFSKFYTKSYNLHRGLNTIQCKLKKLPLKPDEYDIKVYVGNDFELIQYYDDGLKLTVVPSPAVSRQMPDNTQGSFIIEEEWV
jgi:lipopolysaccharide transport system ATP-binding protein